MAPSTRSAAPPAKPARRLRVALGRSGAGFGNAVLADTIWRETHGAG
jgi:hypothetical protein